MGLDCDDVSTEGVRHLQSSSRTRLVDQPGATDIKSFWSKPKHLIKPAQEQSFYINRFMTLFVWTDMLLTLHLIFFLFWICVSDRQVDDAEALKQAGPPCRRIVELPKK